jgi:curved DNA-binding protein CbpA
MYAAYVVLSSYVDLPISYYDLLGINPPLGASSDGVDRWRDTVLRSRWLSLVRVYHPDKSGGSEEAHALFRGLQQANEVLKTDLLRHAYER